MLRLNEDVLRVIFDYIETPLEWVQVSEVCKLWKSAASKQWNRISEIIYLESEAYKKFPYNKRVNTPVISSKDAQRIVKCAASFVKTLSASTAVVDEDRYMIFGPFAYRVENFDPTATLRILAKNATEITELIFDNEPEPKLLQQLVKNNKIKKIKFENYGALKNYNLINEVEELNVRFSDTKLQSFSGHFPNLKSLDLTVNFEPPIELQQISSLILPYVTGVTSLRLCLVLDNSLAEFSRSNFLTDVHKFPQLENLELVFLRVGIVDVDSDFNKLVQFCPKLRIINLYGMEISEKQLRILLTLPQLESLDVRVVVSFLAIEMPKVMNLSKLKLEYDYEFFDIASFCQALEKMPKLCDLELNDESSKLGVSSINVSSKLVQQIVSTAASQNKDIMILKKSWNGKIADKWKVEKKRGGSDEASHTLNLTVSFNRKQQFLSELQAFVQNNVKSHDFFVLESVQEPEDDYDEDGSFVWGDNFFQLF